ncbi:hypothetical protein HanIR_Chr09g0398171 [Helianthus annuus]|nr:hypothetical protein HanIR_Chr09g0398171 [Helianthus annuus]
MVGAAAVHRIFVSLVFLCKLWWVPSPFTGSLCLWFFYVNYGGCHPCLPATTPVVGDPPPRLISGR